MDKRYDDSRLISENEIIELASQLAEHFVSLRPNETPRQYAASVAREAITLFVRRYGWNII